jgi:hypothetical protein
LQIRCHGFFDLSWWNTEFVTLFLLADCGGRGTGEGAAAEAVAAAEIRDE